ncbi:MAG: hypothetical protein CVU05_14865, partial [Bacteroidetes bacterium HGW-Bacteroidetes-21]
MKMTKVFVSLLVFVFSGLSAFSQGNEGNDPILMTIGDRKVTKSEFERIYRKNNPEGQKNDK